MSKGPIPKYRNFYRCSECGTEWEDEWDCTCNDRCPTCNTEIKPYKSEDIVEGAPNETPKTTLT